MPAQPSFHCAHCHAELPEGVRVAFFETQESEDSFLGDFCSVSHAFTALDVIAQGTDLPETLFLGVRVERSGHDESALAGIMSEVATRAVRAALAGDTGEGDGLMADDEEAPDARQLN